jgi:YggT family protein
MSLSESVINILWWSVTAIVVAAIVLIVLRTLFNYMNVNPFSWSAVTVRRLTDPIIAPMRRRLISLRIDPAIAPFVAILVILVSGYLLFQVVESILNTAGGIIYAVSSGRAGALVAIIGYLLYGLLGLYTLAIFIYIILSWTAVSYRHPLMRFLFRITEPLLGPLRRVIPPVATFDISPMIALLIVWLCEAVVAATLLHDWKLSGF